MSEASVNQLALTLTLSRTRERGNGTRLRGFF